MAKRYFFISQSMTGLTPEEILSTRNSIIEKIRSHFTWCECEIIESYWPRREFNSCFEALGESIKTMEKADYVIAANGCRESRGCGVELRTADLYGIKIIHETEL